MLQHLKQSPTSRLALSILLGALGLVVLGQTVDLGMGVLCGLALTCATFVVSGLVALWPMSGEATRTHARNEDLRPVVEEVLIVVLALASLTGTGIVLALGRSSDGVWAAALGLLAVFSAWAMLHFMYSARYASMYYATPVGGIDFNREDLPAFRDFCYFGFNLGMTYQVSDTSVSDPRIRSVVLRHCLLSYLFGTVILAATINVVAGIATS